MHSEIDSQHMIISRGLLFNYYISNCLIHIINIYIYLIKIYRYIDDSVNTIYITLIPFPPAYLVVSPYEFTTSDLDLYMNGAMCQQICLQVQISYVCIF